MGQLLTIASYINQGDASFVDELGGNDLTKLQDSNDATYWTADISTLASSQVDFTFGNPSSTPVGTTATCTIRANVSNAASHTFTATLYQGAVSKGTQTLNNTAITNNILNATGITNYNGLILIIAGSCTAGTKTENVYNIILEVPDGAGGVIRMNPIFFSGD